ncbi:hypothetical protein BST81_19025 [Leptolyngbya sp. 'hensonii']|uniref:hypothetical protein n=1 Tax=Leptolyngbya sp. 'hensonii' TaxID=1922337 RepID=UPI00094FE0B9|nr:hypothetical protein [Leptolyngbya sp. 'hensonii']OLP16790.1 hypothetical protein BST81_19025 [Leptolyngbya sp. 'hensonii']
MKFMTDALSFLRPIRFMFAALMCTMLFLISTVPVQAANAPKSQPTQGTAQLEEIHESAEDVANSPPMSLKEVEERSKRGFNEVQGAADKDKFKSGDSRPVILDEIEKAMDKLNRN